MTVVHSHGQKLEKALHQCPEGPLCICHNFSNQAMLACEDVFTKANDACLQMESMITPAVFHQSFMETLQNYRHFEGLTAVATHVSIHHLKEMAFSKAQRPELVASFALGKVALRAYQQATCTGKHMHNLNGPILLLRVVLVSDQDTGMLESQGARSLACRGQVLVNELLKSRMDLAPLEVDGYEEGVAFVLSEHIMQVMISPC
mmetsp:Transcript_54206/g.96918  ORF Transcript_54206/g.96918 Transcript_54206/m.96918 type:complete len:204 (+) Transcript_54206:1646-2257(+)